MERDLFKPIKLYFENMNYVCDGEVKDIDLYMEKDGVSVAVELKQTLDFKSIQQAALRQKIADNVFIGIFRPKNMNTSSFRDRVYLLKRLGIGLITVTKSTKAVNIITEPVVTELKDFKTRNSRQKNAIKNEFSKRRVKSNVGGVTGEKIMTGYREDALLVLDALAELGGEASPKEVKKISNVEKTPFILRNNYYGWFTHVKDGVYGICDKGYEALEEFEDALKVLKGYHC